MDFFNVTSATPAPATGGVPLGQGRVPALLTFALLGNWGSGGSSVIVEVQMEDGGDWVPTRFDESQGHETHVFILGKNFRFQVPTLTAPGTGATAPRIAYNVSLLSNTIGSHHHDPSGPATDQNIPGDGGLAAFGQIMPGLTPIAGGISLVFITVTGDGAGWVEGSFEDGDGVEWVQLYNQALGGISAVTNGQCCFFTSANRVRHYHEAGTGGDKIWLDVFDLKELKLAA